MSNVVPFPGPARRSVRPRPRPVEVEPLWRDVVGDVLREHRLARGDRIVDVASRAGVAPQYLSEIERGRKEASSEMLSAVCRALDLTVADVARRVSDRLTGPVCLAA